MDDFLDRHLDYKKVHYIEKRAQEGHTRDEIERDLLRITSHVAAQEHISHVHRHRVPVRWHMDHAQLLYFGAGLTLLMLIAVSIF